MVDSESKDAMGLDPHQLLRALGSLLDSQGGAKGVPEILRIASLMKDARKLVARCVYANILKCTKNDDVMSKFVQAGGWETLNIWLQDAKAIENTAFISELLDVYQNVPVTIDLLKQNNCAKTIKQMSKSGDESLVKPCTELVDRWMAAIKSDSQSKDKSSDSSKKVHKHSSSEKSKHSEKPKEDSEKSHSKHDKSHHKSSSHSSKSSHSDKSRNHSRNHSEKSKHQSSASVKSSSDKNSDKSKARTNSLDNRRDSDSSVTSQSSVTSAKVGEKRSSTTTTSAFGSILSSVDETSDVKKAKLSTKDNANRAKTAKTAPTKFRSTGNNIGKPHSAWSLLIKDYGLISARVC